MTDLNALLEKVRSASDGSRELDLEIWNAISPDAPWRFTELGSITCDRYGPNAAGNPVVRLNAFTSSIDDALLAAESAFPGFEWTRHMDDGTPAQDVVEIAWRENDTADWIFVEGKAGSTPLAIVAAVIKAKMAQA